MYPCAVEHDAERQAARSGAELAEDRAKEDCIRNEVDSFVRRYVFVNMSRGRTDYDGRVVFDADKNSVEVLQMAATHHFVDDSYRLSFDAAAERGVKHVQE
jgi:hypothetical protein